MKTKENIIRDRMRQIKKSREEFEKNKEGIILSSDVFMSLVDKYVDSGGDSGGKYMWCDNPLCAYMGFADVDKYENYVCPVEDLSEEDIAKIDSLKPKFP